MLSVLAFRVSICAGQADFAKAPTRQDGFLNHLAPYHRPAHWHRWRVARSISGVARDFLRGGPQFVMRAATLLVRALCSSEPMIDALDRGHYSLGQVVRLARRRGNFGIDA